MNYLPTIISIVSALIAAFAGHKALQAARMSSYHPALTVAPTRPHKRISALFGVGPNDNAGPADIANKLDGIDGATGQALAYRLFAFGYEAHAFGLNKDYAFPEGPNVSASLGDAGTSLTKLLGRKRTLVDKNQYDAWDLLLAAAKGALRAYPDLMSDEPNSANYVAPQPKLTDDGH